MKLTPFQTALAVNIMASLGLPAAEAFNIGDDYGAFEPGRVLAFNASQFAANNPSEFLTNYAVRYTDPEEGNLRRVRELLAPEVRSNNSSFVEYAVYGLSDGFLALDDAADARRAIGADYATVRNPSKSLTTARLADTGLAVEVDEDEELLEGDQNQWASQKVAWLLGILDRTELRTAIALFVASAANTAKTWDTSAGKDPDQDVRSIITSAVLRPNNAIYGPGAWDKRGLSHGAQNTASGFAALQRDEAALARHLMLSSVTVPLARYASAATTLADVVGSYVLLFTSSPGMSRMDASNLKTFTAGGRRVWVRQVGDKRWRIAVSTGKRLVAVTSAYGAELLTIS